MEIGAYSFGARPIDALSGKLISTAQAMRNMLEAIQLAEQVGLDYFGVGEHQWIGMPASSPATLIAAAAATTTTIKFGSSIVVLGVHDPVSLFQQFATADALSNGRVEITAGKGAAIEPFTIFGYDIANYDEVFAEKFDLLDQLNRDEFITWHGKFRPALNSALILPRPEQDRLPLWLATGGNPTSILRAAKHHARLFLSNIGSDPERLIPAVELYRRASAEAGTPKDDVKVGIAGLGLISESPDAVDVWEKHLTTSFNEAHGSGIPHHVYQQQVRPGGSFFVGPPEAIAERLITAHQQLGPDRYILSGDVGRLPHREFLRNIELLGTQVKPLVDRELQASPHQTATAT